jgi:Fe-S cluster assembly scaffold protein SufB
MNKITIKRNIIASTSTNININNNNLTFNKNGEYRLIIENTTNINLNITIKNNTSIKLLILSLNNNLTNKITYTLEENSNLIIQKFYYNYQTEEQEEIYLNGKQTKISYNFSTIVNKTSLHNMKIYHNNNQVTSNIINKCIGNSNSKVIFNIDSILPKGNIGCNMNQDTKIINMGDVDAKINPNMYIEEDDVEARHGSVIGKFNSEDIFYLESRGIPESLAIKLLIKGFILSNLILDEETKEQIINIINDNYK